MRKPSQTFRKDARGNVAILVAVSLMLLVSIVLGTLNVAQAYVARYHLQAALDTAALAAANETIDRSASVASVESQLAAVAQKVLVANLSLNPGLATVAPVQVKYTPPVGFTVPDKIELTASATISTNFLKTLGIKPMKVVVSSTTVPPQGAPVELVLVLDVTGSMGSPPTTGGGAKIDTLKTAAKTLISKVMGGGNPNVKVAIVPYSSYVNVGVQNPVPDWMITMDKDLSYCAKWGPYSNPNGTCGPKVYSDCLIDGVMVVNGCSTQQCDYGTRDCLTPAVQRLNANTGCIGARVNLNNFPSNQGLNKYTEDYIDNIKDPTVVRYPSVATTCGPRITDLTSDVKAVTSAINALTVSGETHIPNGLIWGWNVLAPGQPYNSASTRAELDKIGGRKVMVVMTDGVNSTGSRYYDGSYVTFANPGIWPLWNTAKKVNDLTIRICNNIKADPLGIEIYTVLFDVQDSSAKATMEECAKTKGGDQRFFMASNSNDLLKAFDDIGNQLRLLKITN